MPPQQCTGVNRAHAGRDQLAAVPGGHDDIAILDLPLAGLAAKLADRLRHAGEIAQMIAGEQATAGIDRNAAAGPDRARFHESAALAFLAEAVILELEQHLGGEAVVEL